MISDITLGQYFPGDSALHRLDPRTKIILTVLLIVSVFLANSPVGFFLVLAATVALIAISRISFKVILKGIKPIVFVLIFTAIINVFVTKGEGEPLVDFWIIKIFKEGLIRAFFMSFRVILLITGTSVLLTYTTSPILLTDGLENLLSPLKLVKVPVHILAMMMMIALRFIPTLIEETEKIMNAQKSRGADFTSGSLVRRAKALIPILIPLIISAFKRADELAVAMECRCYRGDKNRTKMRKLKYRAIDLSWFFIGAIFIGAMIALLTLPASVWSFLPDNVFAIVFYNLK